MAGYRSYQAGPDLEDVQLIVLVVVDEAPPRLGDGHMHEMVSLNTERQSIPGMYIYWKKSPPPPPGGGGYRPMSFLGKSMKRGNRKKEKM